MSKLEFWSVVPGTRFVAFDWKVILEPLSLMSGEREYEFAVFVGLEAARDTRVMDAVSMV